nr:reverse transcriptase domain-containing protein [Tanacetum cinerariifolium]
MDHFKDLLCKCPHHGFLELHQIDLFYNSLTQVDQYSLNAAANGNLLNCTPRDALTIIENKSKVPSVKALEETCVTCGGPHRYYECLATDSNNFNAFAATANPRGDIKAITTRSGVSYDGPMIPPTPSPLPKEVERETDATKDKLCEKANNQILKFLQIFERLHFDISFADALLHILKFDSTFKSLLSNKEKLFELASTPLNENCSAVLLKKLPKQLRDPSKFLIPCDFSELEECLALAGLSTSINLMPLFVWKKLSLPELTPTCMTLELANQSVAILINVAKDVFVKVGKFYLSADFFVVDYDVDPRVPLILGRPFLRMAWALIDIHETVNRIDFIDVSCKEYAQEVLRFLDSSKSGNPTPSDPIIDSSSPLFTPFKGSGFIFEEIETFLHTPDELSNLDNDDFDPKGDIALIEKLLNEDPSPNLPPMKNEDLKQAVVIITKPSIEEPPELELKDLPSHIEYAFLKGTDKLPVIISKELKDVEKAALLKMDSRDIFKFPLTRKTKRRPPSLALMVRLPTDECILAYVMPRVDRAKVDVIAKLPHPTSIKGVRSFLGHAGFYRRFIQDFSKIARPMTHLLEKETPFIFSKECIEAFNLIKKKLTEASILVASDWDLPFEIMCDACDYAVEKELLVVVYAFEKFRPYLILSKTIVYTDHSALKYLLAKQDAKPRLLWWILLLQEFDVIIRDKKGAKNLAADHLSRLENPLESDIEKKEINETFPLEKLEMISFSGHFITPCSPVQMLPRACCDFILMPR